MQSRIKRLQHVQSNTYILLAFRNNAFLIVRLFLFVIECSHFSRIVISVRKTELKVKVVSTREKAVLKFKIKMQNYASSYVYSYNHCYEQRREKLLRSYCSVPVKSRDKILTEKGINYINKIREKERESNKFVWS